MAFPTVAARTTSETTSDSSSISVGLGTPSAGDLLVAVTAVDGNTTAWIDEIVSGAKWHTFTGLVSNSAVLGLVAWKVAEGSDALTYRLSSAQQASSIVFSITGHGSTVAAASVAGNSTNGNPPNVSFTGSAQDALFIAALCVDAQVVATVAPAGYANLTTKAATNAAGASVSVADKTANATSDDPGTFTNNTEQWAGWAIAVPSTNLTTNLRAAQVVSEVVSNATAAMRVVQLVAEVVSSDDDVPVVAGSKANLFLFL